jgi:hypothetical protein
MTVEQQVDGDEQPGNEPDGAEESSRGMSIIVFAGLMSIAAGAVHAAAAGIHVESKQLAQIFVITAVLQIGVGVWAVLRPGRLSAWSVVLVSIGAFAGWLTTRLTGISWIDGLEVREAPGFADTACAAFAVIAGIAAYTGAILPADRRERRGLAIPATLLGLFAVWTMLAAGTTAHTHADGEHAHGDETPAADHPHDATTAADGATVAATADDHPHDETGTADPTTATTEHPHDDAAATDGHAHDQTVETAALAWPRPWDPAGPIDVSGVEGVTIEQEVRAAELIERTLVDLQKFADPAAAVAAGYTSIGDAGTGSEHYIKGDLIEDDVLLDPSAPESLVYAVEGDQRTLAGAMFIASARPADDPSLTDWAGPLMTWHKHDNLCWSTGDDGEAKVVGIIDAAGNCARGVRAGGENPMVHVWVTPHPCGVFAALEGVGAGTAAVDESERVDMCSEEHGHGAAAEPQAVAKPYDPNLPIDLGGTPGVTPQQQAAAENLIAVNLVDLPQWSDYRVAEAAGFRSIGDGFTGHEHFVQWDWINDDVALDPDFPESLVFEPQPDGSKKLVSAMYMLPTSVSLADVPDIGGPLMQWHIHDNLCYSNDPEQPRVSGITDANGNCSPGLVKHDPAPMIHVWITSHPCGPFASLEGVAAGQIAPGEERLCDEAHGAH